jgi:hypothetical protein
VTATEEAGLAVAALFVAMASPMSAIAAVR